MIEIILQNNNQNKLWTYSEREKKTNIQKKKLTSRQSIQPGIRDAQKIKLQLRLNSINFRKCISSITITNSQNLQKWYELIFQNATIILPSAIYTLLHTSIVHCHPLQQLCHFTFQNRYKSHRAKSGDCYSTGMCLCTKNYKQTWQCELARRPGEKSMSFCSNAVLCSISD